MSAPDRGQTRTRLGIEFLVIEEAFWECSGGPIAAEEVWGNERQAKGRLFLHGRQSQAASPSCPRPAWRGWHRRACSTPGAKQVCERITANTLRAPSSRSPLGCFCAGSGAVLRLPEAAAGQQQTRRQ
jgi:hypothetical protein